MHRWVPWLMIIGALLHILLGLVFDPPWPQIAAEGLINTVDDPVRTSALWFVVTGLTFLCLALVTRRAVLQTGQVPWEAGWGLIGIGLVIVLLRPADGGWFALLIGVITLVAAIRSHRVKADTAS